MCAIEILFVNLFNQVTQFIVINRDQLQTAVSIAVSLGLVYAAAAPLGRFLGKKVAERELKKERATLDRIREQLDALVKAGAKPEEVHSLIRGLEEEIASGRASLDKGQEKVPARSS